MASKQAKRPQYMVPEFVSNAISPSVTSSNEPKTCSINVGGPINALASNRENSFVAVAGRTILKIYSLEENTFKEHVDLRSGRRQGLNFSSADVAWNHINDNHLATAATNGHIIAWDLGMASRSKQLNVFTDHKRSVTKVCFHTTEAGLLISGSQDATMKMFDLRRKDCVATFYSKSDGVRNVQFSPFEYFNFASSFDNGTVQIWDYRKPNACVLQMYAHKGSVYTLDWHPDVKEKQRLATGGRDSMIKIWDICENEFQEVGCIQTNASVSCVRWRTNRKHQIASVAMMIDHSINIWDTRRPYIPFAQFTEHEDTTTGIEFKQTEANLLFSCSKDGMLYQHTIKDAVRPADSLNPHGLDISCWNCFGQASSDYFSDDNSSLQKNSKTPSRFPFSRHISTGSTSGLTVLQTKSDKEVSGTSSLKRSKRMQSFLNPVSSLASYSGTDSQSDDFGLLLVQKITQAALNYKLNGLPYSELCEHNAKVAEKLNLPQICVLIWKSMETFFKNNTSFNSRKTPHIEKFIAYADEKDKLPPLKQDSKEQLFMINGESNGDDSDSSELDLENYLTDIAKGNATSEFECFYSEEDTDDLGIQLEDMPTEAFQQRQVFDIEHSANFNSQIESPLASGAEETDNAKAPSRMLLNSVKRQDEARRRRRNSRRNISQSTNFSTVMPTSPSPSSEVEENTMVPMITILPLKIPFVSVDVKLKSICSTLESMAERAYLPTVVSCLIVLTNQLNYCPVEESLAEFWQITYLDLLSHYSLWNVCTEVINLSPVNAIRNLNSSSLIHTSCGLCNRRLPPSTPWLCEKHDDSDHRNAGISTGVPCSYCQKVVKGLYTWCRGCSHGGHMTCLKKWFITEESGGHCATGCGHKCS